LWDKTKKGTHYAILGGVHLDLLTPERLEKSVNVHRETKFERVGAPHCNAMRASFTLHLECEDQFFYGCVGGRLEA
jgi:metal-dependent hydrolase (beta-lactamase superfamily II)